MDLAAIPWQTTRYPGVSIWFYASDRTTGRALVLIRMDPGRGYPRHKHRGEEHLLVVQGGYRDERGEHRAGTFAVYEDGSEHAPVAIDEPGSEPCVLLALAHEGIKLLAG
ncbi:MAG: cupin domain-containing protein [Planctomycetes bacterium]|nr:cupin domain-containing protein [Planctomycetota bacterium]